jgi:predicted nucleic acid-binding Zn ribbon protein
MSHLSPLRALPIGNDARVCGRRCRGTSKEKEKKRMNTTTMINTGKTPIFLVPRHNGGLLLAQGSSHILLSRAELAQLLSYVQAGDNE